MTLQLYANLVVVVNGTLLLEQAGVVIDDHVGRRCRVTVESALPEAGHELDGRALLGGRVKLAVHILRSALRRDDLGPPLLEIEGPVVAARTEQPPGEIARTYFTVEDQPPPTDET
jgi:hypothetical protein